MKYRLIIFDSDGTLADTLPWMQRIFNELADEYGFRRVAPEEVDEFREIHGVELLRRLGIPKWKLPLLLNAMRGRMATHSGSLHLFSGMEMALRRLADAGLKLAVVSSNSRANVGRVLGADLLSLFFHLDCGASLFGKAAKLRAMIRRASVAADEAIYIGDEVRDGEAARKAGVAFGAVAWGLHRLEALVAQKPDLTFQTVHELPDKLCG